jgi:hypothetical protein
VPIPNADHAIIAVEKLTTYLLNPSHKRGSAKASFLISLDYQTNASGILESDLRAQHLSGAALVAGCHTNITEPVRRCLRDRRADYDAERKNRAFLLNLANRYWKRRPSIHYHVSEVGEMAFERYGDVILTRDVADRGLRAGDVGTVVDRHVVPGTAEEGYSVEFFDMIGNTVAVVTVPASAVRLSTPTDRPAVRTLTA